MSLVTSAVAWAAYFTTAGHFAWATVGVLILVFGYAAFLAVEFVTLACVQDASVPRAGFRQLSGAWWGEVKTAPKVFCWRQPFRSLAEADLLPPESPSQRGLVMVHGFFCNRAFWNPWMAALRAAGIPFVAVTLEPVFGSIDRYAAAIEAAVAKLERATGIAPVIVAHSMGGLAVRTWLASTGGEPRVHRVVTIGTPHHGTWLARFGHTRNGRQMRIGNPWLARLASAEPPGRYRSFTCFYSHCDNIVFPASTATLPGADNRHIAGSAHVQLAFQAPVFDEVLRWLLPHAENAADPSTTSPARPVPLGAAPAKPTPPAR